MENPSSLSISYYQGSLEKCGAMTGGKLGQFLQHQHHACGHRILCCCKCDVTRKKRKLRGKNFPILCPCKCKVAAARIWALGRFVVYVGTTTSYQRDQGCEQIVASKDCERETDPQWVTISSMGDWNDLLIPTRVHVFFWNVNWSFN